MSSKLNIKIGDDEFFHPFPARTEMKIKSNDLYEKLVSLNAITQLVSRIMINFGGCYFLEESISTVISIDPGLVLHERKASLW